MRKVSLILVTLLLAMNMQASVKGRRIYMFSPASRSFFNRHHRAPMKELVQVYQDDLSLQVVLNTEQVVTITFYDIDGNLLSTEVQISKEAVYSIPKSAVEVEVSYGDAHLVGMLY